MFSLRKPGTELPSPEDASADKCFATSSSCAARNVTLSYCSRRRPLLSALTELGCIGLIMFSSRTAALLRAVLVN